jgi:hypothetical protein
LIVPAGTSNAGRPFTAEVPSVARTHMRSGGDTKGERVALSVCGRMTITREFPGDGHERNDYFPSAEAVLTFPGAIKGIRGRSFASLWILRIAIAPRNASVSE